MRSTDSSFCLSVFRYPLKLAVSAFVAFVAIYHVSLQTLVMAFQLLHPINIVSV